VLDFEYETKWVKSWVLEYLSLEVETDWAIERRQQINVIKVSSSWRHDREVEHFKLRVEDSSIIVEKDECKT
jgi:hypothetical protein